MSGTKTCGKCGAEMLEEAAGGLCPRCLMALNFDSRTMPEDEAPPKAASLSPEEMKERFPQFDILECLGRGGMGVVYKARQKTLDRIVAIKVLAGEWRGDPGFAMRFEKEAKTLAQMNHPNIVTVHDFGETDGLYYIVMEFVDGVNLRDVLKEGALPPEQALAIVPPICDALQYAHDKGIVHRDIKPENLLLDRDGRIKIADFGIATLMGTEGESAGTPPYMAPEQSGAASGVDSRADIYALGVVLYEMLTGERPNKDLVAPSKKVQIDIRLDEIVLRALEKTPALRYQTAGEFRTVLQTMADTPPPLPNPAEELATRACESLYATPEYLATTWGSMKLHEGMATLALYSDRLVIGRGWQTTTIPFHAVRKLSVVKYPRCLSLKGLHSILVEYEEAGKLQRILLTPRRGGSFFSLSIGLFSSATETNQCVYEWFLAIREAITATKGQPPDGSATPELYQDLSIEGLLWAKLSLVISGLLGLPVLAFLILTGTRLLRNPGPEIIYIPCGLIGMGITFLIARSLRKQWQRDNPLPPTVGEPKAADPSFRSGGSKNHRDWWIGGPFQSPEVSEICRHLTKSEKQEVMFYGILSGLWLCLTIWGSVWMTRNFPSPEGWIIAAILLAAYILSQPVWLRMQRKLLCATQWAKAHGYTPDKLNLFSLPFATGSGGRESAQTESELDPTRESRTMTAAEDQALRFSRTAILGAFFAVLCMSAMILQIKVVGIAATAVVTTLLGWIAVTEIRRSAGRLHGMWLAVFDGLLFPLLALDSVLIGLPFLALKLGAWPKMGTSLEKAALLTLTLIGVATVLDTVIIRRVWRAVNSNNPTAPPQTGSTDKPTRFPRKAIVTAAYVCMALSFAVLFAKQWNERKREGEWVPARISNTIGQQYGDAQVRVVDVSQTGQVVLVSVVCEMFSPDHELIVQYGGPVLSYPNDLTSSVNAKVKDLDCLIVPRAKIIDENIGEVLAGTNMLSDRAMFRVGFVLPDSQTAAQVVKQVQEGLLGKPHGMGGDKSVLLLFSLQRDFGKDAAGKPVAEALDGSLWLRPKSVAITASQPKAQTVFDLQPVIELTIPMNDEGFTDMLDPETGQIIPSPNPDGSRTSRKGLLVHYDASTDKTELVGMNGVMTQESRADQWAEITNSQALETLKNNFMGKGGSVGAVVNGPAPHTFLFKTENGRIGILQITRFIENPRSVKIRYKLVQNPAAKEGAPVQPALPDCRN